MKIGGERQRSVANKQDCYVSRGQIGTKLILGKGNKAEMVLNNLKNKYYYLVEIRPQKHSSPDLKPKFSLRDISLQ